MASASTSTTQHARAWEDFRCRQCKRLLFKVTSQAMRSGGVLEAKCHSCNTNNYLVGVDD